MTNLTALIIDQDTIPTIHNKYKPSPETLRETLESYRKKLEGSDPGNTSMNLLSNANPLTTVTQNDVVSMQCNPHVGCVPREGGHCHAYADTCGCCL